jgi:hypothetical protein
MVDQSYIVMWKWTLSRKKDIADAVTEEFFFVCEKKTRQCHNDSIPHPTYF